jgi:hypothetical protein
VVQRHAALVRSPMRCHGYILGVLVALAAACGQAADPLAGRYALALDSHANLPQGAQPFDVALRAQLELASTRTPGLYSARLVAPRFEATAEQAGDFARLADELAKPFAVRVEAGRVVEHRVSRGLGAFAVATLRSITAALQRPDPAAQGASVREWDSTGEYEARYAANETGFIKQKLRYTRLLGAQLLGSGQLPAVTSSRADLLLADGRLQRVVSQERIGSPLVQGLTLDVDNRVELTRRGDGVPAPGDGALATLDTAVKADQPYLDAVPRAAFDAARDDGRSIEALIAALAATQASDRGHPDAADGAALSKDEEKQRTDELGDRLDAFSALVGKLRADPSAVTPVIAAVQSDSPVARKLMSALVAAGHGDTLVAFARDASRDVKKRRVALSALVRSQNPTPAACDLLLSLLGDDAFEEHTRYGLGTYARRLREQGHSERAAELVKPLFDELAQARDENRRLTLLRGIANAASPVALPAVRSDLTSPNPRLREGAIYALSMVKGGDVDAVFAERLRAEPEPKLRELMLMRMAQHRPPSATLVRAMEQMLADPTQAAHWPSIVRALAPWQRDVPAARRLLERTARAHQDASLRAAARASVAGGERKPA